MFYVLRTDPARYGFPSDHIIYGFKTAAAAREYINYFKRARPHETAETLPAPLVSKIIDAARAAYPEKAQLLGLYETGRSGYVDPCVAAFLY